MEKTEILYERVGHLITVAASECPAVDFPDLIIDDENVIFSVSFSNYVKSQIHLNIVSGLFGRKIQKYKYALDFLNGKQEFSKTILDVLHYFYVDMLGFLKNNKKNINLEINVDSVPQYVHDVSFPKVVSDFNTFLSNLQNKDFDDTVKVLEESTMCELIDYVDSLQELENDTNRMHTMAYLLELLKAEVKEV